MARRARHISTEVEPDTQPRERFRGLVYLTCVRGRRALDREVRAKARKAAEETIGNTRKLRTSNDGSELSSPALACDFAEPSESCVPRSPSSEPLGSRVAAPPVFLLPPQQQQWRPTLKSTIAPASTRGTSIVKASCCT
eukprot:scaffold54234_cov60-Phaeocystis_antarctica.AAC.3